MATSLPPRPDRSSHDAVKAKYHCLQKKHQDLHADRTRLHEDYSAAKAKLDKLQAETDMLIEQLHPLYPNISLAVDYVDLDSPWPPRAGPSSPSSTLSPSRRRLQDLGGGDDDDDDEETEDELDLVPEERGSRGRTASSSASSTSHRRVGEFQHGMLPPDMMLEEEQRIQAREQADARKRSGGEADPSESELEAAKRIRIGVMPTTFPHETARPPSKRESKRQRTRSTSSTTAASTSASALEHEHLTASSPPQLSGRSKTRSASPLKQSLPNGEKGKVAVDS